MAEHKYAKVWFTGTHGTGKTTQTLAMAAAMTHYKIGPVHVIQEVAREFGRNRLNEKTTLSVQERILYAQHGYEIDYGESSHLVSDRSVCNLMYAQRSFGASVEAQQRLSNMQHFCDNWMLTCPPDVAFVTQIFADVSINDADPVRSKSVEFQHDIERRYLCYLGSKVDGGTIQFPLIFLPAHLAAAWTSLCEELCFGKREFFAPWTDLPLKEQATLWLRRIKEKYPQPFLAKYLPKEPFLHKFVLEENETVALSTQNSLDDS